MVEREISLPNWATRRRRKTAKDLEYSSDSKNAHTNGIVLTSVSDSSISSQSDKYCEINIEEHLSDKKEPKGLDKYWPVIATGAGLFSDGYVNNSSGFAITILETIYSADQYNTSDAMSNLGAITFVGTVVGMLVFGLISDYWSRKSGMLISTVILIVFSILAAGSWGAGMPQEPKGMLNMLITMRAVVGIGIGGEYPAGSVACAEVSQRLSKGARNRWFIWFTDFMIDCGFVMSAFVCWLLMYICNVPKFAEPGNSHGLQAAWRILMGLGAIAPISLFYLRVKFEDDDQFTKNNFKKAKKTPWWLITKRYCPRLALVSLIWFCYDFSGYSWSTYSSLIIKSQVPVNENGVQNIKTAFGWGIVFMLFYLPGSFLGGYASDYFGPRLTLFTGALLQGIVGYLMAAEYSHLEKHIAGLVVAYGIFSALGEFGAGDNIGLVCSKTSASAVRGRYYAIAAAMGKVGAFAGTYAFPAIAKHYGGIKSSRGQQVLVYISSSLCILSALLALCIPELSQEAIALEDIKFRNYLRDNGYDPDQMDASACTEVDERSQGLIGRI